MPLPWPGREQEQEPGVVPCAYLAALVRVERGEEARAARGGVTAGVLDLDRAVDDDEPRPLVDLMLLEPLAGGQVDHDCPALLLGIEHRRVVRLHVEC